MNLIGVAAILKYRGQLVFEIQKPHKWIQHDSGDRSIGVGCIGGTIEHDEPPEEALQREAREEIGCEIRWQSAKKPFSVSPNGTVSPVSACDILDGVHFFWGGDAPRHVPGAKVAVFVGEPTDRPAPKDLPALLYMTLATLIDVAAPTTTVAHAIEMGASVVERQELPRDATLSFVGTPAVLISLKERSPDLFEQFVRNCELV